MIGDPATAPPRPELTFLRRRSRPAVPAASAPAAPAISFDRPGRRPVGAPPAPSAPAPSGSRDLSTPAASAPPESGSLDLSAPISFDRPGRRSPTPAPSAASAPAASAPGISFDRAGRPPRSSSLDLSDPAPSPTPTPAATRSPTRPAPPVHGGRRVASRGQHLLSVKEPTVTLTRVQSGIGQLAIEAVCSPEVGDLRLGAAYQLRGGGSSTVQFAGGSRFAPSSRRPMIVAGRDEYEYLRLDLRQIDDLERLAVYAFSESRQELTWGGTLVLTTFGGARVELPLETLQPGWIAVLLSLYNLHGELVVRAEMETIPGDVREAARAYGYDRITWRDDRSPVD